MDDVFVSTIAVQKDSHTENFAKNAGDKMLNYLSLNNVVKLLLDEELAAIVADKSVLHDFE